MNKRKTMIVVCASVGAMNLGYFVARCERHEWLWAAIDWAGVIAMIVCTIYWYNWNERK